MLYYSQAIGHISGGHINPAVTAGMLATGQVKLVRAILYIVAQCAGAAAGSGLLKAFTPERAAGKLGVTGLGTEVTSLQGFGIEFFLGFVLIFVVCGVSFLILKYDINMCLKICFTYLQKYINNQIICKYLINPTQKLNYIEIYIHT